MIEIKAVFKRYKAPVVKGVDLLVRAGEVLGLLGPNGAGKTTTLGIAAGIVRPDRGQVLLNGEDVTDWPLHRRALAGLGLLYQEASAFRSLTAAQNVELVLERLGLRRRERHLRTGCLLAEMGLSEQTKQIAATLSGGQRRRLELARALAAKPTVLLLDEPFAGVDPLGAAELLGVIDRLRERNLAVLLSDHDADSVFRASDRVVVMHEGKVVCRGTPEEIRGSKLAQTVYLGSSRRTH